MEPITPKAPSEASVSAETEVGSSSAVQGPEKPLDGIDLCLIALRGQPGVAITDGRIIACADDAAVASAAELSSAALRHLNELVFNNGPPSLIARAMSPRMGLCMLRCLC